MTFNQLVDILQHYKESLSTVGGALRDAKLNYRDMVGEGINTWVDFISQPEIGLTAREATSLIQLHNLETDSGIPISTLNLATAKFVASKGIYKPELIEDMRFLSLSDFKERYHDITVGVDNAPRSYTCLVMKRCNETGNLSRVYGDGITDVERKLEQEYGLR